MSIYSLQTRVSYDEIDQNLNLSLRGALGCMQEAAMIHSDLTGYSARTMEQTQVTWMLIQWRVRLIDGAKWNEPITVQTWPRTMERAVSQRNFELRGEYGQVAAVGESRWVLVHTKTGRIARITPEIAAAYELTQKDVFDSPMPDIPVGGGEVCCTCRVQRRDIDTNHHVNNRVYLDYAREALPAEVADAAFREVSVRYHKQLLLGDLVQCRYFRKDHQHIVDLCSHDMSVVHGTVVFSEV